VRHVSNESRRWGPVAKSWEYNNELQRPVMLGTRRVGPDLSREGGRRSNDWHMFHFFRPRMTSPESVMPDYPWFFESTDLSETLDAGGKRQTVRGPTAPNKRAPSGGAQTVLVRARSVSDGSSYPSLTLLARTAVGSYCDRMASFFGARFLDCRQFLHLYVRRVGFP
jgi:cbb3-type cytochrome oxidase cytochrome c subunit